MCFENYACRKDFFRNFVQFKYRFFMKLSQHPFGKLPTGETAHLFILENDHGLVLKVTNYGGTMTELWTPDRNGKPANVLLGFATWEEWFHNTDPYFGCLVGRTCNRIDKAQFTIDGITYQVTPNQGTFQLHGGAEGFNKKFWNVCAQAADPDKVSVTFEYVSPDGEEGFPGNVHTTAVYSLNNQNEVSIEWKAVTDRPTPVNLTNHAYWNLRGEGNGTILDHELTIFADAITETNADSIPTGKLLPVAGTPWDFRTPHKIGERIGTLYMGYDDNYCLRNFSGSLELACMVTEPESGRKMEVLTTEVGMQLYTANWFTGTYKGLSNVPYQKHAAFCTETQHWPDSMNHANFPNVILRPGNEFNSQTIFRFSTVHL